MRLDWLAGWRAGVTRSAAKLSVKMGGGRKARRSGMSGGAAALAVEVLEVRQVMSETPLTPTEISDHISDAATEAVDAETDLQTATDSFNTQVTTSLNGLQSVLDSLHSATQGLIDVQRTTVQSLIDGAKTTLDSAVDGLNATLQGTLDGFKATLDGDIAAANSSHQSQVDTANAQLQTEFNTIQSGFDANVAGLLSGFQANVDAARGIFDGAVSSAQSIFDGAVSGPGGFDDQFDSAAATELSNYQTNEGNDWNSLYLNVIGTGPTGLQTTYTNDLATADSTLAGVVALYPSVTYDPASFANSPSFVTYVSGQVDSLLSFVQGEIDAYNANVDARLQTLNDQIYGPSGASSAFQSQLNSAEATFDADMDTLNGQLASDLAADRDTYQQAVSGVGGFEDQLEANLATDKGVFDGAVALARGIYDGVMAVQQFLLDTIVDGAIANYDAWLNGGNPYQSAMDLRLQTLEGELTGYLNTYDIAANNAKNQLDADVLLANQTYWDEVFDPAAMPTSPYDSYFNAVTGANQQLSIDLQFDYNTYHTAEQNYSLSVSMAMMTWMMSGMMGPLVLPDPSILDQAAKDYWVSAAIDGAIATNTATGAWESFISTAVGKDTTRQQSIINALATYSTTLANAEDALMQASTTAIGNYENDIVDLSHAFDVEAAQRALAAQTTIENAINAYDLAQNGALNTFRKAGHEAAKTFEQSAAADLKTFREQEAGAWKTLEISAAGHQATWQNGAAGKIQTLLQSQATAVKNFTQQVNLLQNQAEQDINGYEVAQTQNVTQHLLNFTTNVGNQLANDIAAASGFAPDVTAVANAHNQNGIDKIQAAKNLADGEANAYRDYANQESTNRKTANDNVATAAETRAGQVAGAYVTQMGAIAAAGVTQVNTLAPQAESAYNSIAGEAQNAAQSYATKQKTFNDSVADADQARDDSHDNSILSYLTQAISAVGANVPLVDALQTAFDHFEVGQLIGLEAFSETQQHLADLSEIGQRQTTALSMATLDDPLINATAHRYAAQLRNGAWNQVATYQGLPTSYYSSLHPSGPVPAGMAMTSLMVISRPVRPGTPPPPPPPPPSTPVDMDPFAEPEIGFWNGLKTGLKALTNSAVDTVGGVVTLGQWDPPDVWPVNPMTDIGYDGARFAADIATNTAMAAATGGMGGMAGRVGQVARAVDRLDGVGNVVVGVQGGINALQNGVNLQNGMQMLNGILGGAQLGSAGRLSRASEIGAEAQMSGHSLRAMRGPSIDSSLGGSNILGYTTPNGRVYLRPGLTHVEQVAVLRHESVHAFFSVADGAPLAQIRQRISQWGYDNSAFLNATEEMIAEGFASGSIRQALQHAFNGAYVVRQGTRFVSVVTAGAFLTELGVGATVLGLSGFGAYEIGESLFGAGE